MNWLRKYRIKCSLKSSLWIAPVLSLFLGTLLVYILRKIDSNCHWIIFGFGLAGARALLATVAGTTLSFIVVTFSFLLIAVQLASASLTPRIIASLFSDRSTKVVVSLFIFTYIVSAGALGRMEEEVPQLTFAVALCCSVLSIAAFLYLIDYFGKALRPVTVTERIGLAGREVIEAVYPDLITEHNPAPASTRDGSLKSDAARSVLNETSSGVILAVDFGGLAYLAGDYNGTIEVVPQIGDFLAKGELLFRLYDGAGNIPARRLRGSYALGPERTLEQDPTYAFRMLVDIAAKALSPAINDPTTAVLCLDQIHRLLRAAGTRYLDTGEIYDDSGKLRLRYKTPDWEDFVVLGISEIRIYGGSSLQVVRRLQAMLENLISVLPQVRIPALKTEMELLHRTISRSFPDEEVRTLAAIGDAKGLGSA